MVTVDDIAKVVSDRLKAVIGQDTTCPGGHWFDRGPDNPASYPYDVFRVEAGEAEQFSGAIYVQHFTVTIAGYCPMGASGVDTQAVEQLFHNALVSESATAALRSATLRNATDKVLHAKPVRGTGEFDETLREGRDVFVAGLVADVLIQGDGSVS